MQEEEEEEEAILGKTKINCSNSKKKKLVKIFVNKISLFYH